MGGGHYSEKGNGANYLCLATDPDLGPVSPDDSVSHMYGAEYEVLSELIIKSKSCISMLSVISKCFWFFS